MGFKLRHLLLLSLLLMTLIALAALAWNGYLAKREIRAAEWAKAANQVADLAIRAGASLAVERGITATALAAPNRMSDAMRVEMLGQRAMGEAGCERLSAGVARLRRLAEPPELLRVLERLRTSRAAVEAARQRVDRTLVAQDNLTPERWIEVLTEHINALSMLRRMVMVAADGGPAVSRNGHFLKEVIYTATEYAGRERAVIGVRISAGELLSGSDQRQLERYRGIVEEALNKLEQGLLAQGGDHFTAVWSRVEARFLGDFQALRKAIYAASASGSPYPVDAFTWYSEATTAINTLLGVADAVSRQVEADLERQEARARLAMRLWGGIASLLLGLLALTAWLLLRRGFYPLRVLEQAADTIAAGNLEEPIPISRNDELGSVARSFETMRRQLRDDLLQREEMARRLRESERRFRELVETTHDWIWEVDCNGIYTYSSPQVKDLLGYAPEEVVGHALFEFMPPEEAERMRTELEAAVDAQRPITALENLNRHRDGSEVWLETSGVPVVSEGGELLGYRGIDRDITQRRRLEAEARKMQRVVEQSADLVIITSREGRIEYVNPAFVQVTGYSASEVVGGPCNILKSGKQDAAFYAKLWRTIEAGEVFRAHMVNRKKSGELYHEEKTITPLRDAGGTITHFVSTAKDVTDRRQAELQLQQSEKLASIGQLAAGVAHEINNPVGYISSNLGTLEGYLQDLFTLLRGCEEVVDHFAEPEGRERFAQLTEESELAFLREDVPELLSESREGVKRVKRIVQDLKDFSRGDTGEWQYADLRRGLESTLNIVHNELKYKATVVREFGELPAVECIPAQLNQVFMNLLVNAGQAIEKQGTISVRCGQEEDWVWVEVADSGAGMSPETRKQLFDPFFTTKPVGTGTGLGLYISYGIIEKHQGRIEVESQPGEGSRFRVWLPIHQSGA